MSTLGEWWGETWGKVKHAPAILPTTVRIPAARTDEPPHERFRRDAHYFEVTVNRRYAAGLTANLAFSLNRTTENRTVETYDRAPTLWQTNQNSRPYRFAGGAVYELPFGKGQPFLENGGILSKIVGGWQISMISRYRSGLPSSLFYGGVFPTNFSFGAIAYPISSYTYGTSTYDQKGNPSVFASTTASSNWLPMYAGSVGTRAAIRLAGLLNFDIAVAKAFQLPWENQRIQLRGEAFNAFNNVNFYDPVLDARTATVGARLLSTLGYALALAGAGLILVLVVQAVACGPDGGCGRAGRVVLGHGGSLWFVLMYAVLWLGPAGRLPGAR